MEALALIRNFFNQLWGTNTPSAVIGVIGLFIRDSGIRHAKAFNKHWGHVSSQIFDSLKVHTKFDLQTCNQIVSYIVLPHVPLSADSSRFTLVLTQRSGEENLVEPVHFNAWKAKCELNPHLNPRDFLERVPFEVSWIGDGKWERAGPLSSLFDCLYKSGRRVEKGKGSDLSTLMVLHLPPDSRQSLKIDPQQPEKWVLRWTHEEQIAGVNLHTKEVKYFPQSWAIPPAANGIRSCQVDEEWVFMATWAPAGELRVWILWFWNFVSGEISLLEPFQMSSALPHDVVLGYDERTGLALWNICFRDPPGFYVKTMYFDPTRRLTRRLVLTPYKDDDDHEHFANIKTDSPVQFIRVGSYACLITAVGDVYGWEATHWVQVSFWQSWGQQEFFISHGLPTLH